MKVAVVRELKICQHCCPAGVVYLGGWIQSCDGSDHECKITEASAFAQAWAARVVTSAYPLSVELNPRT